STPLAAYGVFLPVFAEAFAWSRGAISTALSVNLLVGGLAGFAIGAMADRHGPRVMLFSTLALAAVAFALVSTVDTLWELYLFVGVLGGVGMSSFYLLSTTTVTRWFGARRGLALALMVSVHTVPFAHDQGISRAGASLALTAYGIGAVSGRIGSGVVSDRLGTFATVRAGYLLQLVALLLLLRLSSHAALLGSLVLLGMGFAAADTMLAKAVPEVFGMRALGAILGVLNLGWRLGAALGPAAAGFLYDLTGSYAVPFGAAPAVVLASWGLFA